MTGFLTRLWLRVSDREAYHAARCKLGKHDNVVWGEPYAGKRPDANWKEPDGERSGCEDGFVFYEHKPWTCPHCGETGEAIHGETSWGE